MSEYLVFSVLKHYINNCNSHHKGKIKFISKGLTDDLHYFKAEINNKAILIFRSSNLKNINKKTEYAIFKERFKNRSPDIIILKKDSDNYEVISVIEIKNYLDNSAVKSGINILKDIEAVLKSNVSKNTKYVLFSYGDVSVKCDKNLEKFDKYENHFYCFKGSKKPKEKYNFKILDLSEFFERIKEEVTL